MKQRTVYPPAIRLLHWAMAVSILGLIASGWYMAGLDPESPQKYALYPLHKSFGVLMLVAWPTRLLIRLGSVVPKLPAVLANWEKPAAHAGHVALYLLMLAVPISGYVMSGSYEGSQGINFFGLLSPRIVPVNDSLFSISQSLHGPLAWGLLSVVSVHIIGVIKHRYFDRAQADVLPRMLGRLREAAG